MGTGHGFLGLRGEAITSLSTWLPTQHQQGWSARKNHQIFNLVETSLTGGSISTLIQQTGMFAYPASSSLQQNETETSFLVAFWQAIFPVQSKTSRYQLEVMNNDGSNLRVLFPLQGQSGLEPRISPVWAPHKTEGGANFIGVIYEGNLWIVDAVSGQSQQVTGDGSTSQIDWK